MRLITVKITQEKNVRTKRYLLLLIFLLITLFIFTTLNLDFWYPTPASFFSTSDSQLKKIIYPYLLKSNKPVWKNYYQETIQRKSLISQLPEPKNYLDWQYGNGLATSPLYADYVNSLRMDSLDLTLFSKKYPIKSLSYYLNLNDQTLSVSINLREKYSENITIKISPTLIMHKVANLSPDQFWLSNQQLHIAPPVSKIELTFLVAEKNLPKKIFILLPPSLELTNHIFTLFYPPQKTITTLQIPNLVDSGLLQYNLPTRGISQIEFNL